MTEVSRVYDLSGSFDDMFVFNSFLNATTQNPNHDHWV